MTPLNSLIGQWISCSNDLWLRWFAAAEGGVEDFLQVEEVLLKILVLEKHDQRIEALSSAQFYERMRVTYRSSVTGSRQICRRQRAGNVFCSGGVVSISQGESFRVKSIDTMGTMLNGTPYVEVMYGEGYLLESPELLDFEIDPEQP